MKDGYEKQKKEIERQYDNKISKLKEEKALTEEAQKIKDEAIINLEKKKEIDLQIYRKNTTKIFWLCS